MDDTLPTFVERLSLDDQVRAIIAYTCRRVPPQGELPTYHKYPGSFDVATLEIRSRYSKQLTDRPVDSESTESIDAWATMIHEWVHFMQFCSTTLGLHITLNSQRQQIALVRFCNELSELGEGTLFVPLIAAIEHETYGPRAEGAIRAFINDWFGAEILLLRNQGIWVTSDGESRSQGISEFLRRRLSPRIAQLADKGLTLSHILEPIAVGCQGQWLISHLGRERALGEIVRLAPGDPGSTVLPQIEAGLGINPATRMILHDLSLLAPIEYLCDGKKPSAVRYCATTRLVAALELIAGGQVTQARDSGPENYAKLASDLGNRLGWPPMHETVDNALRFVGFAKAMLEGAAPGERFFSRIFDDFERAFKVRKESPDAFLCLTPQCLELYESGWQPVWHQPEGWLRYENQSAEQAEDRIIVTVACKANRAIVLGGSWDCPCRTQCEARSKGNDLFPGAGPDLDQCHCRRAFLLTTGGRMGPEHVSTPEGY